MGQAVCSVVNSVGFPNEIAYPAGCQDACCSNKSDVLPQLLGIGMLCLTPQDEIMVSKASGRGR